jgi:hypothetical protein
LAFDDPNLVANAGLLLVATLVAKLGLEDMCNSTIRLGTRVGGFRPGRKILTLVHAMVAGASHIDHADVLRAGSTSKVLPHRVMALSTLGTFLRAFSFGHVRQFEKVIGDALGAAWSLGVGPGGDRLVADIDSTIREVYGKLKGGAAYGYTKVLGYHPILATRADTGEILHARIRTGSPNTQRGTKRFVEELVARLRRAGASGQIVMRFDSGYWCYDTIKVLGRLGVSYTMAVRTGTKAIRIAIAGIDEAAWVSIDFAFLSDLDGTPVELDAFHRRHAVVELCIDDWKEGAGMEHCPSGDFSANAAWMCCAVLAHNLIRWSAKLGGLVEEDTLVVAQTLRTRYFSVPARLVNRSGTPTLRGPTHWPWATSFTRALTNLRSVAFAPI